MAARRAHNPEVGGSSPSPAIKKTEITSCGFGLFLLQRGHDSNRVNAERQRGQADRMSAAVNEAPAARKQDVFERKASPSPAAN